MFNQLNEMTVKDQDVNEELSSAKLKEILSLKEANRLLDNLTMKFGGGYSGRLAYRKGSIDWKNIRDEDLIELSPEEGRKVKDGLVFWYTTQPKKNPYADGQYFEDISKPTLLAVSYNGKDIDDMKYVSFGLAYNRSAGLTSYKKIAELADKVVMIPGPIFREAISSAQDIHKEREGARKGAVALMDPKDIARANNDRYKELLADKNADVSIKDLLKEVNTLIGDIIDKAIDKNEKNVYGELMSDIVDKRGRQISLGKIGEEMKDIYDTFKNYIKAVTDQESAVAAKAKVKDPERASYYDDSIAEYGKEAKLSKDKIRKEVDLLKGGKSSIWW